MREEQAGEVRERLLRAALALMERGEEPTMRSVATEAAVAERTIYRYFNSLEVLHSALRGYLQGRAGVPLCARAGELEAYAAELYAVFEANRELISSLVSAPWAAPTMRGTRRENLVALRQLIDEGHPEAPEGDRAAATSLLRVLLSGAGWHYLRVACGLDADEVVEHARWAISAVRDRLRSSGQGARSAQWPGAYTVAPFRFRYSSASTTSRILPSSSSRLGVQRSLHALDRHGSCAAAAAVDGSDARGSPARAPEAAMWRTLNSYVDPEPSRGGP